MHHINYKCNAINRIDNGIQAGSLSIVFLRNCLLTLALIFLPESKGNAQSLGEWNFDSYDLPSYNYTGPIDFQDVSSGNFPDDPWFILGNYRIIAFPHVSGLYDLMTGERAWSKINHPKDKESGNKSVIQIGNSEKYVLTGKDSELAKLAKKTFGTGFASYFYDIDGLSINRTLTTLPGSRINESLPAILIKVVFTNNTKTRKTIAFTESVVANYTDLRNTNVLPEKQIIRNKPFVKEVRSNMAVIGFESMPTDPHLIPKRSDPSKYDGYPPKIFMAGDQEVKVSAKQDQDRNYWLNGMCNMVLKPNMTKTAYYVIGVSFNDTTDLPEIITNTLVTKAENNSGKIPFLIDWRSKLPLFLDEKDEELRREMVWNAYVLEVMATYSSFYNETYIPQGCAYEFARGSIAGSRDHLQHLLPVTYYNPELAKSILRYVMKKMLRTGEIPFTESGVGFTSDMKWRTSDQQLFLFLALSEYLRVTGDYAFLKENILFKKTNYTLEGTVFDIIEQAFIYFRDEVRIGIGGLPRLMNSDWNDQLVTHEKESVNFFQASSHLNATMAVFVLNNLSHQLTKAIYSGYNLPDNAYDLIESIDLHSDKIWNAITKEMELRDFSRRAWLRNDLALGETNMYLSPQVYLLQIDSFPIEEKMILLEHIETKLMNSEVLGARTREITNDAHQFRGEGENGGIWYALNGPTILGVATYNKQKALLMLKNMSFSNYANQYPNYWIGHWSGSDHFTSSLSNYPGMINRKQKSMVEFPVFCGHAHAWPLYVYFKINEPLFSD